MYNKIVLLGNLTRDVELRYSQNNTAISKTAIATSRKFTGNNGEKKEEVCFVDITMFGRTAEIANQYLRKGSKVIIEGRLMFDQWTDDKGEKHSKHSVVVETMNMIDTKSYAPDNAWDTASPYSAPKSSDKTPVNSKTQDRYTTPIDDVGITEEEIPF